MKNMYSNRLYAILSVCLAVVFCFGAAHAADDSDFIGTWILKTISFSTLPAELDAETLGVKGSLTITENKIISDTNGEVTEAEWSRKSDDTISIVTESGDMDFVLDGNALVVIGENENGDTTKMTFYKPGNTCNCEELLKQIADLTARIEALEAERK